jgi:hypothetical protein
MNAVRYIPGTSARPATPYEEGWSDGFSYGGFATPRRPAHPAYMAGWQKGDIAARQQVDGLPEERWACE